MDSIRVLFLFILVLCVSHYMFFYLWNLFNKPVTDHTFFEYNNRIEYVSTCFHKMNASVCGDIPKDLQNRVTMVPLGQGACRNRPGILVRGAVSEQQTDFEAMERWCFHALQHPIML